MPMITDFASSPVYALKDFVIVLTLILALITLPPMHHMHRELILVWCSRCSAICIQLTLTLKIVSKHIAIFLLGHGFSFKRPTASTFHTVQRFAWLTHCRDHHSQNESGKSMPTTFYSLTWISVSHQSILLIIFARMGSATLRSFGLHTISVSRPIRMPSELISYPN